MPVVINNKKAVKIAIIPDCQVKPGVNLDHLAWAGDYLYDKQPDYIVQIGDFADLPSLSSYDIGKKSYEGRTYRADIESVHRGLILFDTYISGRSNKIKGTSKTDIEERIESKTRKFLLLGNHEQRIHRAVDHDRKLDGSISVDDLGYAKFGWSELPFLDTLQINKVYFSHYFTSGVLGKPVSSARVLLTKKHCSAVMGHVQRRDIAYDYTAEGKQITTIFCGTYYQHEESYLGPQGNKHWRGIWMLHNVKDGEFDEMPVNINYLKQRFFEKYKTTKG